MTEIEVWVRENVYSRGHTLTIKTIRDIELARLALNLKEKELTVQMKEGLKNG